MATYGEIWGPIPFPVALIPALADDNPLPVTQDVGYRVQDWFLVLGAHRLVNRIEFPTTTCAGDQMKIRQTWKVKRVSMGMEDELTRLMFSATDWQNLPRYCP